MQISRGLNRGLLALRAPSPQRQFESWYTSSASSHTSRALRLIDRRAEWQVSIVSHRVV